MLSFLSKVWTQNYDWKCGTDEVNYKLYISDTEIQKSRYELTEFIKKYISENRNSKENDYYIIPVVFHIVHYYGVENISDEQILDAVTILNNDFRKMNSDTSEIEEEFKTIAGDTRIEFRLAKLDPDGNCTIGITRHVNDITYDGSAASGIHNEVPGWPRNKYLNIWVCNNIPGGIAGYSFYPSTVNSTTLASKDGLVIMHSYVGSIGTSNTLKSRILTHEIAHALDLSHTWARASFAQAGSTTNCSLDDEIEDTPNTIGNTSCNLNAFSCNSKDNVQNYMEYSYCSKMFTIGQGEWIRAALNSSIAQRNNLWTEQNLIATGTNNGYISQLCMPIAEFHTMSQLGCENSSFDFINLTSGTSHVDQYYWYFEGGYPESSYDQSPTISYPNKGLYSVSLEATNQTGTDIIIKDSYIHIYNPADGLPIPYSESFESENYPIIDNINYNDFYTVNKGNGVWEITEDAFYSGNKSLRIRNRYNTIGVKNYIYLPIVKVSNPTVAVNVSFKAAYGRTSTTNSDKIKLYISKDCGRTKSLVYSVSSTALTSTYVEQSSNYVPQPEHWKTHSFNISTSHLSLGNFRLIIESETGGGNAIYIDDISFNQTLTNNKINQIIEPEIFPNPTEETLFVRINEKTSKTTIELYDISGKLCFTIDSSQEIIDLSSMIKQLDSGIYILRIKSFENIIKTQKIDKL